MSVIPIDDSESFIFSMPERPGSDFLMPKRPKRKVADLKMKDGLTTPVYVLEPEEPVEDAPSEMKEWQHGYDIDLLKKYEERYKKYNTFSVSPFSQFKKNDIAAGLHEGWWHRNDDCCWCSTSVKVKTPITMCGDVVVGTKEPGDLVISAMAGKASALKLEIDAYKKQGNPIWIYSWAEHEEMKMFIKGLGFKYIFGKITTFGEIYDIWFWEPENPIGERSFPKVKTAEHISIKCLESVWPCLESVWPVEITKNLKEIHKLGKLMVFDNHYSNYNKKDSWSAFSLRGYSKDPLFIAKPVEMSKKWKEEHQDVDYQLQNTAIYFDFANYLKHILEWLANKGVAGFHRIRLMKINPGGGELSRHTDQVDPDMGASPSKLMRLHFPLVTNDKVIFTSWNYDAKKQNVHMPFGSLWYLDIRKPHMAVNGGTEERIHLVIDVVASEKFIDYVTGERESPIRHIAQDAE